MSNKVVFREGRAWQVLAAGNRPTVVLKLLGTQDFQPITVTTDSQVYLAPAKPDSEPAAFTGTVLVRHGFIRVIQPLAGVPGEAVTEVLQQLRRSGADLSGSWVIDQNGSQAVKASELIAAPGAA
jgi:hypothetical protein